MSLNFSIFIKLIVIFLLINLFIFEISCRKQNSDICFPLAATNNINESLIIKAFDDFKTVNGALCLVISRNEQIVAEEYFNGSGPDSIHDVRSVTKSFNCLLVGLALDQGFLKNVNEPVSKYLTGIVFFPDSKKANITLDQVMKMSFGHEWNGTKTSSLYNTWAKTPDHLQYIIDLPLVAEPGTVFNYSDGASHLLSVIITVATGKNTFDFAKEFLFGPLEINNFRWEKDDKGYPNGAAGLSVSPHDMVKFGNLIINKGRYKDKQIIPEIWISSMTTAKIHTANDIPYGPEYGYQIWIGNNYNHKNIFAMGWGGQFIFIVPDQKLVVVATCKWNKVNSTNAGDHWYRIITIIVNKVLPSVN